MRRTTQSSGRNVANKQGSNKPWATGLRRMLGRVLVAALVAVLGMGLVAIPAQAQVPVTEILNSSDEAVLHVNEDGGLLGLGAFESGAIPVEGAGTRLMWHPAKAAFRSGRVGASSSSDGTEWDEANVGDYSVAFGRNVTASGDRSTAMGNQTTASGFTSVAMGSGTVASASYAVSMGLSTTASGAYSTAMSSGTTASGRFATAMGKLTTAQAFASLVVGQFNVAVGNRFDWVPNDPLIVAGNGSNGFNRSNALTLEKDGDLTIAGTLTENSDRRLKTGIQPLGSALDALLRIQPVTYRFKANTGHPTDRQIGLVAQEVQKQFPELVSEGADGYLSLAYPKLTAVLLQGLQEQQTQIETLRAENEAFREQIRQLQSVQQQLTRLEAQLEGLATTGEADLPTTGEAALPLR